MSYPCSIQFEESSNNFLLWSPQAAAAPHENVNMYQLDGDHYSDHQQDHEFLDIIMVQELAANDLLQHDLSFSNADPLLASYDEKLAVAGQEKNGNLAVAVQEELMVMESTGDLLLAGAMAVEAGDAVHASAIMSRLDDLLAVADIAGRGSCEASPVDNLACYFARGLKLRITDAATPAAAAANRSLPAYRMLQELTPFIKFAHFTANQAILEATADDLDVHVVDFNVGDGVQWSSLMSDLAAAGRHRSSGSKPLLFHLTAIVTSGAGTSRTADVRRWLSEFAESLHLPFRYSSLHVHDGDVHHELAMICNGSSSSVILTCDDTATTPYYDTPLHRLKLLLLGTVAFLNPKLVILIEDELFRISKNPPPSLAAAAAAPPFPEFFSDALAHFTAVMESTASCLMSYDDDEAWLRRVEEEMVGPRVEDAVRQYGSLAGGAQLEGLRACEVSSFSVAQGKMLAGLFGGGFGVVHQEKGRLALICWKSRPLISVSVWCPK